MAATSVYKHQQRRYGCVRDSSTVTGRTSMTQHCYSYIINLLWWYWGRRSHVCPSMGPLPSHGQHVTHLRILLWFQSRCTSRTSPCTESPAGHSFSPRSCGTHCPGRFLCIPTRLSGWQTAVVPIVKERCDSPTLSSFVATCIHESSMLQ
jgi:hypothetical protein